MTEQTQTPAATDDSKLNFGERLAILASHVTKKAEPTDDKPMQVDWKDGVSRSTLREKLGYTEKQDGGFAGFLRQAREFFTYQTMVVEHKGTKKSGKQMATDANVGSRSKFIDFCKNEQNYKLIRPGVDLPTFNTRETSVPDALSLLDGIE